MLSHLAAAWLWGLLQGFPAKIDITAPSGRHRHGPIRCHRARGLRAEDRARREEIPVTALPRTLLDLAAVAPRRLERGIERSEQLGIFDLRAVDSLLARTHGHPGRGALRRALWLYRAPSFTRSELERRFLRLVKEAGLPAPAANTFVAGHEIDAYWERERFAVELDGYETHGTRAAFERDPVRQEDLKLAGIDSIRITARRVEREPDQVVARLRTLLARPRG